MSSSSLTSHEHVTRSVRKVTLDKQFKGWEDFDAMNVVHPTTEGLVTLSALRNQYTISIEIDTKNLTRNSKVFIANEGRSSQEVYFKIEGRAGNTPKEVSLAIFASEDECSLLDCNQYSSIAKINLDNQNPAKAIYLLVTSERPKCVQLATAMKKPGEDTWDIVMYTQDKVMATITIKDELPGHRRRVASGGQEE